MVLLLLLLLWWWWSCVALGSIACRSALRSALQILLLVPTPTTPTIPTRPIPLCIPLSPQIIPTAYHGHVHVPHHVVVFAFLPRRLLKFRRATVFQLFLFLPFLVQLWGLTMVFVVAMQERIRRESDESREESCDTIATRLRHDCDTIALRFATETEEQQQQQ